MKKHLAVVALVVCFAGLAVAQNAPDDSNKVSSDYALRISRLQLDQANQRNILLQVQTQYQASSQAITHDDQEINQIKAEALGAAKKDPKEWDIDLNAMKFIPKPKAAAAPPAADPKKK